MRAALVLLALALTARAAGAPSSCAQDTGITLPAGFCATVFADHLGEVRHLTVDAQGTVYAALSKPEHGGAIVVLRDTKGAGRADSIRYFGDTGGTGIGLYGNYLYFATDTAVLRYKLGAGASPDPQTVVGGFPEQGEHAAKTIAFDGAGHLYVNVGAPSNACQEEDREPGSPGRSPCPLLQQHGGIWRFDADKAGQRFPADGERYVTGIRNAVALTWGGAPASLYALQMGRDQLADNWPKYFDAAQSAELPSEEFLHIAQGDDYGWPYCYYDQQRKQRMQAPEYGGDGKKAGDCGKYGKPIVAFPGHWAPEAVQFYTGKQFPARYQGGAFVSFHGSWNRAPMPQAGYKVVFVPFAAGKPSGDYEVFADGFAGTQAPVSPGDAKYRPMGLAEGPDGSLYIGDTQTGRIWKITYSASQH